MTSRTLFLQAKCLTLVALCCLAVSTSTVAQTSQNPLRTQPPSDDWAGYSTQQVQFQESVESQKPSVDYRTGLHKLMNQREQNNVRPSDSQVHLSSFQPSVKERHQETPLVPSLPIHQTTSEQTNEQPASLPVEEQADWAVELGQQVAKDAADPQRSAESMQDLLQKMAINTCVVLVLGVSFVLMGRKWFMGRSRSIGRNEMPREFQITSTLKIGPKSLLHLVQVDGQQILVACDSGGIKSVISLNQSFADVMQADEEPPAPEVNIANLQPMQMKDYLAAYIKNEIKQA